MPTPSGTTPTFGFPYPLETDIPDVATAIQVLALAVENLQKNTQVPVGGSIKWWSSTMPTQGVWLPLIGGTVPAASYPALATAYPSWVGSGVINLPDTRDRFIIGAGGARGAGATGGAATVTLATSNIPSMSAAVSISDPTHVHDPVAGYEPIVQAAGTLGRVVGGTGDAQAATIGTKTGASGTGISGSVSIGGSSSPFSVMPPSIAAYEIIRAA